MVDVIWRLTGSQDAWDSYIQGPNAGMDTSSGYFPMDLGGMPMQTDTTGMPNDISNSQQQNGGQQPANANAFGNSMFMAVGDTISTRN